jgi:ElaB/YqjD/DUF883 family membrane-anchored ribosome-binding protein
MSTTSSDTGPASAGTANSGADSRQGGGRLSAAQQGAADAYRAARERTSAAYASARQTATSAARSTADGIEGNPMVAVVGGLALGAIAGVLLPVSRQERQLFGNVGRRINDTAREAALAARDAGREQLDGFTDRALGAVRASANAAADSVRG